MQISLIEDAKHAMRKPKSAPETLASIMDERARFEAQIAELDRKAKLLRDQERDAGRKVLIAALERVRIADMSREEAKIIAETIGNRPAAELVALIQAGGKSEGS